MANPTVDLLTAPLESFPKGTILRSTTQNGVADIEVIRLSVHPEAEAAPENANWRSLWCNVNGEQKNYKIASPKIVEVISGPGVAETPAEEGFEEETAPQQPPQGAVPGAQTQAPTTEPPAATPPVEQPTQAPAERPAAATPRTLTMEELVAWVAQKYGAGQSHSVKSIRSALRDDNIDDGQINGQMLKEACEATGGEWSTYNVSWSLPQGVEPAPPGEEATPPMPTQEAPTQAQAAAPVAEQPQYQTVPATEPVAESTSAKIDSGLLTPVELAVIAGDGGVVVRVPKALLNGNIVDYAVALSTLVSAKILTPEDARRLIGEVPTFDA